MCGIIGAFKTTDKASVNEEVITQFEDQHSRGSKGFGVVGIDLKGKMDVLRATEGSKFMFDLHAKSWPMMMVHHRMPTSTENWMSQTHPLLVSNELFEHDYLVVHNGVISQPGNLKKEHEELGIQYRTEYQEISTYSKLVTEKFNDSEAIAIEIALFIENKSNLIKAIGSAAFMVIQVEKKTQKAKRLFFGRNDRNPLNMAKTRNSLFLSSEGKGDEVTPDKLYSCELKGDMKLTSRPLYFKKEVYTYNSGHVHGAGSQTAIGFKEKDTPSTAIVPKGVGNASIYSADSTYRRKVDEEAPVEWTREPEDDMPGGAVDEEVEIETVKIAMEEAEIAVEEYFTGLADPYSFESVDINTFIREIRQSMVKGQEAAQKFHMARQGVEV